MTYITKQGDMFDSIACELFGSAKYTDALIAANTEYIDTFIFPSGVVLNVPDVQEIATQSDLPPWKQVVG